MSLRLRLAHLLITLHPPAWCRRYGAEVVDLVAAVEPRWNLLLDLARSAAGEWFNPSQRVEGSSARERVLTAATRTFLVGTAAGAAGVVVSFLTNMAEAVFWDGLRYVLYGLPPKIVGYWLPNWK